MASICYHHKHYTLVAITSSNTVYGLHLWEDGDYGNVAIHEKTSDSALLPCYHNRAQDKLTIMLTMDSIATNNQVSK
jgi:hypothetical protein